jgi:hypothetical protein
MKRTFSGAALTAALFLAACGTGDAGGDDLETQPAGRAAPTAQTQASPQTGPNTPEANAAEALPEGGSTTQGRSYSDCMAEAASKAKSDAERGVMETSCRNLPGAPGR